MDAVFFQKVKAVFAETVERNAADRAAFLREKCGDDLTLLAEIESLLAAFDEPENLIEANAFSLGENLASNGKSYLDKEFGHYKIRREIGQGGMGAVFLAERADGEFSQQVALKIIRQTIVSPELERHFRRERQILASLNHPNIARLLDGGVSAAGEPYFVMEYVEGENLPEFTKNLSIAEKLKLFLKICGAVEYAHRNLVIHRDIKPSNILVTKDGEPKLLDFGLAKIEDESFSPDATQTTYRALTPAYASPEQLRGNRVSTASDIYSMGVVLYELLSGEKPFRFENKSLEEILRTVTNVEPPPPSSAVSNFKLQTSNRENPKSKIQNPKSLRGDLDNITLTALRKEPERRYKSVAAFAEDIEKYLSGLPISARPNTFSYRAARFYGRNKIAVSATGIVILALIAGLTITLWQANEARREHDKAQQRFEDVRKISNSMLSEIMPKIERLPGSTEAREILVKNALEYLDRLAGESSGDEAALQSELAVAYEKIADLQGNPQKPNLNDFDGAIESYEKARKIRLNLPETATNQRLLAKNYRDLSNVEFSLFKIKKSLEDSQSALKIYEKLIADEPSSLDLQIEYADAQIEIAAIFSSNNQYGTAIPIFEKSLENLSKLDQTSQETTRLTAKALASLANAHSWNNQQTEAETEIERARKTIDDLSAKHPNDNFIQKTAFQIYGFGSGVYENQKNDVALEYALEYLKIAERAVANDPADSQAKNNLARAHSRVGISYVNVKKISTAMENLRKAEVLIGQLVEQEPKNLLFKRDLAKLFVRLGDAEKLKNNFPEAVVSYQKSADLFETIARADEKNMLAKRDLAQSLKSVGEIFLKINETEKAKQNYQKAADILQLLIAQNALGDYDRKMFDEVQKALQKL